MQLLPAACIVPLLATVCSAWPSQQYDSGALELSLVKRVITPDNTCGSANNYTCDPSNSEGGSCCSAAGYCGNSTDYCGTGCQSAYGTCTRTTSADPTPDETDLCGLSNNGLSCGAGQCCSVHGYCGTTDDYCLPDNCQTGYGNCTTSGTGSTTTDDGGQCGSAAGGASCPSGQCCSAAGWCGTGTEYCADPDCQYQYGTCDSDTTPAGSRTDGVDRPLVGSVTYSDDIYDCVGSNIVGLSYDDGPYEYTSELLDLLDQFGFKATFFITGNNLGKGPIDTTSPYPDLIQRMISSGHQVASHTWSHYSLQNISQSMRIDQMVKNEMAFLNIIGKYPTYMRPPYSQCDEASGCWADMQALGYHRILFDLDTEDYLNPLPSQIQNSKNIVDAALDTDNNDYLSIQHDIVQQSVTNLTSYYYGVIQAKGWKGVTVGTCLGDPEENWYRQTDGSSGSAAQVSSSSVSSRVSTSATSASSAQESSTVETASVSSATAIASSTLTESSATSSGKTLEMSETVSSSGATATSSATKASSVTAPSTLTSDIGASSTAKSSPSPSPTSTKQTTSSVKTTTAPMSTTTASVSSCIYQAVSFCGTLKSFTNAVTCRLAAADCDVQLLQCPWKAGLRNAGTCSAYGKTCTSLSTYCSKCARSKSGCSKEDFLS